MQKKQDGMMKKPQELKEFSDAVYLKADDLEFYETEGGLLGVKYKNYNDRVNILRIFPLTKLEKYISVRDKEFEELGIIEDLNTLSEKQRQVVNTELDKRYFMPVITSVSDIKEDFGNLFWVCETTSGPRSFTVRDLSYNLIFMSDGAIVLVDTDGNRYKIEDVYKLGAKAVRYLDIWI